MNTDHHTRPAVLPSAVSGYMQTVTVQNLTDELNRTALVARRLSVLVFGEVEAKRASEEANFIGMYRDEDLNGPSATLERIYKELHQRHVQANAIASVKLLHRRRPEEV